MSNITPADMAKSTNKGLIDNEKVDKLIELATKACLTATVRISRIDGVWTISVKIRQGDDILELRSRLFKIGFWTHSAFRNGDCITVASLFKRIEAAGV